MPLTIFKHSCAKTFRTFAVLFMTVMFCIFTGCTQFSNGQKTSVLFCIDSNTAQQILGIAATSTSSRAAALITEEELKTAVISVSLKGDFEQTTTNDFSASGVNLSFSGVPVGARISAQAEIYYIDSNNTKVQICSGESESITVKGGKNSLSVDLTITIKQKENPQEPTEPEEPAEPTEPEEPTELEEPVEPETPVERELYEYKYIEVNDNWHFSIFNEYLDVVTCKEATATSITFTLNHELNADEGMLQVVFGDSAYVEGKSYVCSYKIQGPVPDGATGHEMNVCCWVTKNQGSCNSAYNSTSPTETSYKIECGTTDNGGILFFPQVPGEYTISDVSVVEIDPSAQSKTECTLEIKAVEAGTYDDIQVTVTEPSDSQNQNYIFTAPEGFGSYSWTLKLFGEEVQTSNTNKIVIDASTLTKGVVYDLILFADNKSYTRQLKVSE